MREDIITNFSNNFSNTFFNYDDTPDRHSPVILIYLSLYKKLGLSFDFIRLLHINILPICVFFFFKCLKIKYPQIKNNLLLLLSLCFFFFLTMRELSIWPDSRIYGLLFFLISVFFYLKFNIEKKCKYALLNTIFLCFASYLSPNYGLFFLLFFYNYCNYFKFSKETLIILFSNLLLAFPAYYYLFKLKVFFLSNVAIGYVPLSTRLNLSNKILIISSIIFFYFIPFVSNQEFINKYLKKNVNYKIIYISLIITSFLFLFFSYKIDFTGGGIFFQISQFIFKNNILFFIISFLSIIFLISIWNINFNNKIIIFCLMVSTPQLTIYHKYFDPLLIVLFFLLFDFNYNFKKIININFLKSLYFFYFCFLSLNYLKILIPRFY